ncbi:MAG: Jag N-terminal domain-containing protein, partial [Ruminococcus sp.]|nr:Jag N-terminal domain-containing protein [Ruminococcus sp.]
MTEIFTAKTVEEAKKLAVQKFGRNIDEINFEIIEEATKGFFGIG